MDAYLSPCESDVRHRLDFFANHHLLAQHVNDLPASLRLVTNPIMMNSGVHPYTAILNVKASSGGIL